MDQIIKKLFFPSKIQIVGVSIEDSFTKFELLLLKKKGEQISVLEQRSFNELDEIILELDKNLPLILHIDGKGILNKKIDLDIEQDLQWYKNFDSKKLDYFQYKEGNDIFLSITKNETVLKYLEPLKANNFKVIDVVLGSFCAIPVKQFIGDSELFTKFYSLQFDDNKLQTFDRNSAFKNVDYSVGNEKLNSVSIVLFGAFLTYWSKLEEIERTDFVKENEINDVFYENAFRKTGVFILGFFFVTLLSSYLGVVFYTSKNADLNYQCQLSKETISKLESIEKNKKQKLEILNETGLVSKKYLTNYSFDILNSVPNAIQIVELNVNPSENEVKEGKKILFENRKISLKGSAREEFLFNQWVSLLRKMEWIKKTEILSVKRNKVGQLEFELKITIKYV